jgi:16S rRNA (uracil1498-N3)-methyltransferase
MQIRLFISSPKIKISDIINLDKKQTHYLLKVMRQKIGAEINVFNAKDGEFRAEIIEAGKLAKLKIIEKIKDLRLQKNIELVFCPVKNVKTEYLVTKATELGVRSIQPIISERTIVNKINLEKLNLNMIEALEQSERNDFVEIKEIKTLKRFMSDTDQGEQVIFCDERGKGKKARELKLDGNEIIKIIIGPEGGFTEKENKDFEKLNNCQFLSLGDIILRADTAIISALAIISDNL